MTDIDFDELDKAVSSLMQPKKTSSAPSAPVKTLDNVTSGEPESDLAQVVPKFYDQSKPNLETSQEPDVRPESTSEPPNLSSVANQPTTNSATSASKINFPKRGRFMDVVRTSPVTSNNQSPKLVPRQELRLEPTNENALQSDNQAEPEFTDNSFEPTANPVSNWPDPIDMQPAVDETLPSKDETLELNIVSVTDQTSVAPSEPLVSPFLPDAKVDKRPLGGVLSAEEPDELDIPEPEAVERDEGTKQNDDYIGLPEELNKDILAVEADLMKLDEKETSSQPDTVSPEVKTTTSESEASKNQASVASKRLTPPTAQVASLPKTPLSPGSLPQQQPKHTESVIDDTEPDSSIFDSEHYQAPVKHPVKKKSGWLGVIAIVSLVLIGTLGGIGFYLYTSGY